MLPSHFLIAASSSGCGKTTITLGLLRALRDRGYNVQPFKCGPDYIDPHFHQLATGRPSLNLDLYLSSPEHITTLYRKYTQDSAMAVIEGVMGLYDGYDRWKGSSAEIAKVLDIPVVLLLQPKAMAYSVAALINGFANTPPYPRIAGVIFNQVNSESHYRILSEAAEEVGVTPLGYIPNCKELTIPSRHLGLSTEHLKQMDDLVALAAKCLENQLDIELLLHLTEKQLPFTSTLDLLSPKERFTTAIAYDEAFLFVYQQNIDYFKSCGEVYFFSPIRDTQLPSSIDFLYLPGGYPELYLKELSANQSMLNSIRNYIEKGGKVLAECGGMMYLSNTISDSSGQPYPMVGVLDQDATMQGAKLSLGYRNLVVNGVRWFGHEFHYSKVESNQPSCTQQYNAKNMPVNTPFLRYKNVVASYTHLYWADGKNIQSLFSLSDLS